MVFKSSQSVCLQDFELTTNGSLKGGWNVCLLTRLYYFWYYFLLFIIIYASLLHIPDAVLITGGAGAAQSAELFLPWSGSTCSLQRGKLSQLSYKLSYKLSLITGLPDERVWHTQAGGTLCGGGDSSISRSCLKWEGGDWTRLPLTLSKERWGSSVWSRGGGLYIMGGGDHEGYTSDYVEGNSAVHSFSMKYKTE